MAARRYHVIASIDVSSQDLRLKRKRESDIKDRKVAKTTLITANGLSRNSITKLIDHSPRPTSASTSISPSNSNTSPVMMKAPIDSGIMTLSKVTPQIKGVQISNKKKSTSKLLVSLPPPTQVSKNVINRSTISSSSIQTNWMIISNLPRTVCGADVKSFLNGLKIQNIYGFYHYGSDDNMINGFMDVYIHFDSKAGVEAAMLRNGESIIAEMNVLEHKSILAANNSLYVPRKRVQFVTSLDRVNMSESSWARALCIKLKDSPQDCYYGHQKIRAVFPLSLLIVSPSVADRKWSTALPLWKCPTYDEICSFSDHQKKLISGSLGNRYDYHDYKGLYLDVHTMSDGLGSTGLAGFPLEYQEILCKRESMPIYGTQDVIPLFNDVNYLICELSDVISQEIISSYSTSPYTQISDSNNLSILDLAHRMLSIYQNLHDKIKCIRFSYSNTCKSSDV